MQRINDLLILRLKILLLHPLTFSATSRLDEILNPPID